MNAPNLELHIENLILHDLPHLDQAQLSAVIQQELARLFTERGVPASLQQPHSVASLDGETFMVSPDASVETVGSQIAQAVYGGFSR
jgi:hypothetical protein